MTFHVHSKYTVIFLSRSHGASALLGMSSVNGQIGREREQSGSGKDLTHSVTQTTQLEIKLCPVWSREGCGETKEQSHSNCNQIIGKISQAAYTMAQWRNEIKWAQFETGEVLTVYKPKQLHYNGNPEVRCITQNGSAVSILGGFQDHSIKPWPAGLIS